MEENDLKIAKVASLLYTAVQPKTIFLSAVLWPLLRGANAGAKIRGCRY